MSRWRTRHRGSRAERGAAAVEFAIVLVVLLLIIFGIIDFGRLLWIDQAVKAASREGARVATVKSPWRTDAAGTTTSFVYTKTNDSVGSAVALAGGAAGTIVGTSGSGAFAVVLTQPTGGGTLSTTGTGGSVSLASPNSDQRLCPSASSANYPSVTVRVTVPFKWFTPTGIFLSNVNSVTAETTMRCE